MNPEDYFLMESLNIMDITLTVKVMVIILMVKNHGYEDEDGKIILRRWKDE